MKITTRFVSAAVIMLFLFLGFTGIARAGINQWTTSGPSELNIYSVAASPNYAKDGTIFVGTGNGVFMSTDCGSSWTAVNNGITTAYISSVAISPNYATDQTVFAGSNDGDMFKSTNGGAEWTVLNTDYYVSLQSFIISPNYVSDRTVYAVGDEVLMSTDGGMSWTDVTNGVPEYYYGIYSFAISPNYAIDKTFYAGTSGSGTFKSTNGGTEWTDVNNGIPLGAYISSLAVSPNYGNDQTVYAGINGFGVYKSTNGGASWTDLNTGLTDQYGNNIYGIYSLVLSPNYATDQTIYAGTSNGVFISTNGGTDYTAMNTGLTNSTYIQTLALSPNYADDHTVLAGTYGGVWSYTSSPLTSAITAPTNGMMLSGVSCNITGTASDVGGPGLANVQIGITPSGGTTTWYMATGTTSWSYMWTLPADGRYTIMAKSADSVGNTTPSVTVNVMIDNTPPTVNITYPAYSSVLKGTTAIISGTATSTGHGVAKVEVSTDGGTTWYSATGTTSWSYRWTLPANGSYTLQAQAKDSVGNKCAPISMSVSINNTLPKVAITPHAGTIISAVGKTITGTASDAGPGVAKVEVSIDGGNTWNPATGTTSWRYKWQPTIGDDGFCTITAMVADKAGNWQVSPGVSVMVDTTPPTSAIYPLPPTNLTGKSCIITGTASDAGSGVKNVQVGITPSGGITTWHKATGTTSWLYKWPLPNNGNYTIQSKATDKAGNVETPTDSVSVTVSK